MLIVVKKYSTYENISIIVAQLHCIIYFKNIQNNLIMKKTIFLLVIIAFAFGCEKINSSKKDTFTQKTDSTDVSSSLIGKWSWFSTCGLGNDKLCYTPESTNCTQYLVFTHDSIYNYFKNDTLRGSSPFHTYREASQYDPFYVYIIDYDSIIAAPYYYSISHDTLTMSNIYGFLVWINRFKKVE